MGPRRRSLHARALELAGRSGPGRLERVGGAPMKHATTLRHVQLFDEHGARLAPANVKLGGMVWVYLRGSDKLEARVLVTHNPRTLRTPDPPARAHEDPHVTHPHGGEAAHEDAHEDAHESEGGSHAH